MLLASANAGDIAYYALSVFLLAVGLGLAYAFIRLGGALGRLSSLIGGVEKELTPVISKAGGSIDRVNGQLDKLDIVTDSAVDAVETIDTAIRAVTLVVKTPVQKVAAWTSGLKHGVAAYRVEHDFDAARQAARAAAQEREQEIVEDLRSSREREE